MKVLPFPVKIYPFEIFIRATPGIPLVYHNLGKVFFDVDIEVKPGSGTF